MNGGSSYAERLRSERIGQDGSPALRSTISKQPLLDSASDEDPQPPATPSASSQLPGSALDDTGSERSTTDRRAPGVHRIQKLRPSLEVAIPGQRRSRQQEQRPAIPTTVSAAPRVSASKSPRRLTKAFLPHVFGLATLRRKGFNPFTSETSCMKATIHPKRSKFIKRWDIVTMTLLLIVAVLTPFEVAFLEVHVDFLFFFNRMIDLLFIVDMVLQFFMQYQNEDGLWVADRRMITWHYLHTWFLIDLLSVMPFDILGFVLSSDSVAQLRLLKIVRLARLIKLARILRAGRIFQRWEAVLQVNYATFSLLKFGTWMLVLSHWLACAWQLTANIQTSSDPEEENFNWQTELGIDALGNYQKYLIAVYWALATLSTVGYGDVIPRTTGERFVVIASMLIGAAAWTYIVANVCGIVSTLDAHSIRFKQVMDDLNDFINDHKLNERWGVQLREYFQNRRRLMHTGNYSIILEKLSPGLRGKVGRWMTRRWYSRVPFLPMHPSCDLYVDLALALEPALYAPSETIDAHELHILERGIVMKDSRVIPSGCVWGEDMILSSPHLMAAAPARALTYVDVQRLPKDALNDILIKHPDVALAVRRYAVRLAVRRGIVLLAVRFRMQQATQFWDQLSDAERHLLNMCTNPMASESSGRDKGSGESSGSQASQPGRVNDVLHAGRLLRHLAQYKRRRAAELAQLQEEEEKEELQRLLEARRQLASHKSGRRLLAEHVQSQPSRTRSSSEHRALVFDAPVDIFNSVAGGSSEADSHETVQSRTGRSPPPPPPPPAAPSSGEGVIDQAQDQDQDQERQRRQRRASRMPDMWQDDATMQASRAQQSRSRLERLIGRKGLDAVSTADAENFGVSMPRRQSRTVGDSSAVVAFSEVNPGRTLPGVAEEASDETHPVISGGVGPIEMTSPSVGGSAASTPSRRATMAGDDQVRTKALELSRPAGVARSGPRGSMLPPSTLAVTKRSGDDVKAAEAHRRQSLAVLMQRPTSGALASLRSGAAALPVPALAEGSDENSEDDDDSNSEGPASSTRNAAPPTSHNTLTGSAAPQAQPSQPSQPSQPAARAHRQQTELARMEADLDSFISGLI